MWQTLGDRRHRRGKGSSTGQEAIVPGLRTYSKADARYIATVLETARAHYGDRVTALEVFGSYARGENRLHQDGQLPVPGHAVGAIFRNECGCRGPA